MTIQPNAANRKDIRAAEKAAAIAERNRGAVTRRVMADEAGRRWLWELLASCGIFDANFYDDPHRLYFRQGERNVGLRLLNDVMQYCPDQYIQAMEEANDRRIVEQQLFDNATDRGPVDPADRYAAELAADLDASERLANEYRHPDEDDGAVTPRQEA